MEFEQSLSRVALALGIGLLIGLERGWRTREAEAGSRTAGIRTFAISGLLGGVIGLIVQVLGGPNNAAGAVILAAGIAIYAAVITVFSRDENKADGTFSATTAVAGILTVSLGAYAIIGDPRIAAAAAVAGAAILALRDELHGWVKTITWPELRSGLVLLAMTFIAMPIMPDSPVGPFGGVNPREVWIIAIVLASVSFVGYAGVKYLGASRGVLFSAAVGGLVSSTAVAITNARRAATGEGSPRLLAAGVAIATAISFLRVAAIVAVMQPTLLILIGPALMAATTVAVGFGFFTVLRWNSDSIPQKEMTFRNPFGFFSVIAFTILLSAMIVLGRALGEGLGAGGAIAGSIAVGLVDVDSVTVAMARLTPYPLRPEDVAYAILAAVASNILSKVAIGAVAGRYRFAIEVGAMALLCVLAGGATLALTLTLRPV